MRTVCTTRRRTPAARARPAVDRQGRESLLHPSQAFPKNFPWRIAGTRGREALAKALDVASSAAGSEYARGFSSTQATGQRLNRYQGFLSYGNEAGESRAYEFCTTPLTFLNSPPVCSLVPSTCSSHTRL